MQNIQNMAFERSVVEIFGPLLKVLVDFQKSQTSQKLSEKSHRS